MWKTLLLLSLVPCTLCLTLNIDTYASNRRDLECADETCHPVNARSSISSGDDIDFDGSEELVDDHSDPALKERLILLKGIKKLLKRSAETLSNRNEDLFFSGRDRREASKGKKSADVVRSPYRPVYVKRSIGQEGLDEAELLRVALQGDVDRRDLAELKKVRREAIVDHGISQRVHLGGGVHDGLNRRIGSADHHSPARRSGEVYGQHGHQLGYTRRSSESQLRGDTNPRLTRSSLVQHGSDEYIVDSQPLSVRKRETRAFESHIGQDHKRSGSDTEASSTARSFAERKFNEDHDSHPIHDVYERAAASVVGDDREDELAVEALQILSKREASKPHKRSADFYSESSNTHRLHDDVSPSKRETSFDSINKRIHEDSEVLHAEAAVQRSDEAVDHHAHDNDEYEEDLHGALESFMSRSDVSEEEKEIVRAYQRRSEKVSNPAKREASSSQRTRRSLFGGGGLFGSYDNDAQLAREVYNLEREVAYLEGDLAYRAPYARGYGYRNF